MESLGLDIKLLIAQTINVILFFLVFKKFAAKPFKQFLLNEKKKEEEKENVLMEMKKKEEELLREKQIEIERIKEEQNRVVKAYEEEAKAIKEKIIAEAKKEAEAIITKSRIQSKKYQEKIENELDQRVKELSLRIATEALSSVLTPEMQREINKRVLEEINNRMTSTLGQLTNGFKESIS